MIPIEKGLKNPENLKKTQKDSDKKEHTTKNCYGNPVICNSCGSIIPRDKRFCHKCGGSDHGLGLMRGWFWW